MAAPIINDPTKELGYFAKRSGLWAAGKQSAEALGEPVAKVIEPVLTPEIANSVSAIAGTVNGMGGLVMIGLAGSVSAALTQMDYVHRKDNLKEVYREELALKLNKPIDKLTRSDLDELAKTNSVVREELARNSKQRYFGVGLSMMASMASLAVIKIALPAAISAITGVGASGAMEALVGSDWVGAIGAGLIRAAVGLTTYHLVKEPLHYIADKLFGIDEKTTNDYIVNIKRDKGFKKTITREQVLAVFASANPDLDAFIVAEYGKHFDDLSAGDKQRAASELNNVIPLDRLALEINSGKINPSELAFAVEGQISGVNHEIAVAPPPKPGLIGSMLSGVSSMLGFSSLKKEQHGHEVSVTAIAQITAAPDHSHYAHKPEKSFVKGLEQQQARAEASVTVGQLG